jgi:hypothetical protein
MYNESGLSAAQLNNTAALIFRNLRKALTEAAELYSWTSGLSSAELVTAGFSGTGAADMYLSAAADGHALYLIHTTGLPPGSYPQPSSAYVYAASQNQVIGPQ